MFTNVYILVKILSKGIPVGFGRMRSKYISDLRISCIFEQLVGQGGISPGGRIYRKDGFSRYT